MIRKLLAVIEGHAVPQLKGLPEVVLQTLVFSRTLCYWVDDPEKSWLNRSLGIVFRVACLLPVLGLLAGRAGVH